MVATLGSYVGAKSKGGMWGLSGLPWGCVLIVQGGCSSVLLSLLLTSGTDLFLLSYQ